MRERMKRRRRRWRIKSRRMKRRGRRWRMERRRRKNRRKRRIIGRVNKRYDNTVSEKEGGNREREKRKGRCMGKGRFEREGMFQTATYSLFSLLYSAVPHSNSNRHSTVNWIS